MISQCNQLITIVKEECKEIINIGGEITDIKVREDFCVEIHFLDHMCDYGRINKVLVVEPPTQEEVIAVKKQSLLRRLSLVKGLEVIDGNIMVPRDQDEIIKMITEIGEKNETPIEERYTLGGYTILRFKE